MSAGAEEESKTFHICLFVCLFVCLFAYLFSARDLKNSGSAPEWTHAVPETIAKDIAVSADGGVIALLYYADVSYLQPSTCGVSPFSLVLKTHLNLIPNPRNDNPNWNPNSPPMIAPRRVLWYIAQTWPNAMWHAVAEQTYLAIRFHWWRTNEQISKDGDSIK